MSYIKREAAIKAIENDCSEAVYYTKRDAINCLLAEPTADVVEVRYGEWIYGEYDQPHCSECGFEPKEITPYCPMCGAYMDEERSGNDLHA